MLPGAPPLQISQELADSCCQAVHTYIHAQQMLAVLVAHPAGGAFRRVSQHLQLQAARACSLAARNNINAFNLDVGGGPGHQGWSGLTATGLLQHGCCAMLIFMSCCCSRPVTQSHLHTALITCTLGPQPATSHRQRTPVCPPS